MDPKTMCGAVETAITNVINLEPPRGNQINDLNLFSNVFNDSTRFRIEEVMTKKRTLVPTKPYCCDYDLPSQQVPGRKWREFDIPSTGMMDAIQACDVIGQPKFGMTGRGFNGFRDVQDMIAERAFWMRDAVDMTMEYRSFTALTGVVRDADGSELLNMWDHFGVNQVGFELDLDSPDFDLDAVTREIKRTYASKLVLGNNRYTGILFLMDSCLFENLVRHPKVKAPYENCCARIEAQRAQVNGSPVLNPEFTWNGVTFREYHQEAIIPDTDPDAPKGSMKEVEFLQECTGIGFPIGVSGQALYEQVIAPRPRFDEMNRPARQMFWYSGQFNDDMTNYKMHVEANWLPIVKQPRVLTCLRVKGGATMPEYVTFEK